MIITRPNYKNAFLAFNNNGLVKLNKKTIGQWMMVSSNRSFHYTNNDNGYYKAKVYLNRDSMTTLYAKTKFRLMRKVCDNIEDAMLTRL